MSKAPAPTPALDILCSRNLELGPFVDDAAGDADPWQHWRLRTDADNIAWLLFDKAGASNNTLDEPTLTELNAVLHKIEQERPRGLVIRSAKPSGFAAGADIAQFRNATDSTALEAMLAKGHAVLDRVDNLPLPTVAVIHGFCLGGGLELALACDSLIAVEDASFGFPEVLLGLHPGLGGTVRLPRRISPVSAMTMMLTGKTERARRAKSLGIVDAVTLERHVRGAVKDAVDGRLKSRERSLLDKLLSTAPARSILAFRMRREAAKKAPEKFYPAPYALIDLWVRYGGARAAIQREEIKSFVRLLMSETSRNLVRVFFLREKLKGLAKGEFSGRRVHVIGAGAMGGDIAAWCAWHGFVVTLADMKPEPLAAAIKKAADLYSKIAHGDRRKVRDALDRLTPDLAGEGVPSADLIIEAVPEILDLKQKIFAGVESKMKPDAILATNTSSIPLENLREGLRRPERLVGIHFFNPVSRMQLVEVVSHDKVADDVTAKARAFLGRIDRLPAPVQSEPGFLVNRALTPYMLEAMVMLNEGVKMETIDKAAEDFGMPMGPIELADEVGLDICLHVAEMLRTSLRDLPPPPAWLIDKVKKGELGKKSGRGFYEWKDGRAVKPHEPGTPPTEMADRLVLPMLNVCMECLRTGVVADEEVEDGAMIFATGFAPFRGGPMLYARKRGFTDIRDTLARLATTYGPRFLPDSGWDSQK